MAVLFWRRWPRCRRRKRFQISLCRPLKVALDAHFDHPCVLCDPFNIGRGCMVVITSKIPVPVWLSSVVGHRCHPYRRRTGLSTEVCRGGNDRVLGLFGGLLLSTLILSTLDAAIEPIHS